MIRQDGLLDLDAARELVGGEHRIRILMADDDRNEQLLIVVAAEEVAQPIDFTFVDDGVQLLLELERLLVAGNLPDLVLLDLDMPVLDGRRTLAQLHHHPNLWEVPVLVFSSSTRRVDQQESLRHGARWFETKPPTFSGMVEFVATLADRAGSVRYRIPPLDLRGVGGELTIDDFDLDDDVEIDLRFIER